jgi:hypothetical protein
MQQVPAKYLVLIDLADASTALLFTEDRTLVAEFDGGSEEVAVMTKGLIAKGGADDKAWDRVLSGSSNEQRAQARVYTLDV